MKSRMFVITIFSILCCGVSVAQSNMADVFQTSNELQTNFDEIVMIDSPMSSMEVGGLSSPVFDTVPMLPISQRTKKKSDRGILTYMFIPKGEWILGLNISHASLHSKDSELFQIVENFNAKGSMTTFAPFFGSFFNNNQCVGGMFSYGRSSA